MADSARDKHRAKLLGVLGNADLEFFARKHYPAVLGISRATLYHHFDTHDLAEIENDAVDIRRKSCSKQRQEVLEALRRSAVGFSMEVEKVTRDGIVKVVQHYPPNKAAAQEFLDRTEGKVLGRQEITGKDGAALVPVLNVTTTKG